MKGANGGGDGSSGIGRPACRGCRVALDPSETETMLEWLPLLSTDFPEAVELAIRMPVASVTRGTLIYYLHEAELQHGEAMARL